MSTSKLSETQLLEIYNKFKNWYEEWSIKINSTLTDETNDYFWLMVWIKDYAQMKPTYSNMCAYLCLIMDDQFYSFYTKNSCEVSRPFSVYQHIGADGDWYEIAFSIDNNTYIVDYQETSYGGYSFVYSEICKAKQHTEVKIVYSKC